MIKLSNYLKQVDSILYCLKNCQLDLSLEDYTIGDNLTINEDDGIIWVKSLLSIIKFEDTKFDLILDYEVEIPITSDIKQDQKNITVFFKENDKILDAPLSKQDIKAQVLYVQRLLGGRELSKDIQHLFLKLFRLYGGSVSDMDMVHLEVLLSQCLRDKDEPMLPARVGKNPHDPNMVNIKQNVFNTGFLQGLAFENVGKAITTGLLTEKHLEPSILEKVLTGTLVEEKKEE